MLSDLSASYQLCGQTVKDECKQWIMVFDCRDIGVNVAGQVRQVRSMLIRGHKIGNCRCLADGRRLLVSHVQVRRACWSQLLAVSSLKTRYSYFRRIIMLTVQSIQTLSSGFRVALSSLSGGVISTADCYKQIPARPSSLNGKYLLCVLSHCRLTHI